LIQQIEIDIQKYLREKKDLKLVSKLIWEKWKNANFDLFSINSFCSFLFQAQEWELLILASTSQLKKNAPVSWDYLAEALSKVTDENLRAKTLQQCLSLFQTEGFEIPFLRTYVFDPLNSEVANWRSFFLKQKKREQESYKNTLIDQLQMFKHTVHFSDYEKNVLIKLERMYPNNPQIMKITEDAKAREFKDILTKYGKNYSNERLLIEQDIKAEGRFKSILLNECKKAIKDLENDSFDFVYLFIFIEAYEEAIQILERIPNTEKSNWLTMDLLMLAKKYNQALSWTDYLEYNNPLKYDLDKLSQLAYHRARCLWELGKKQNAIETIQDLLKWNPEYRIASHLLYEWKTAV
jgi:hypothetical protein